MEKVLIALLYIGGPMALVQLIYRIADHNGNKTAKLVKRFPVLKEKKFLIQIAVPLLFMLFFGVICVLCSIPAKVFFVVCGAVVGLINGLAVTIMYKCE